jgi:hypothetical protein
MSLLGAFSTRFLGDELLQQLHGVAASHSESQVSLGKMTNPFD